MRSAAVEWIHAVVEQLPIVTEQIHFVAEWLFLLFFPVNSIFVSFSVCRVDGVDSAGHISTVTYSLSLDSMTTARGYDAMREDPDIYKTLDFCGYSA